MSAPSWVPRINGVAAVAWYDFVNQLYWCEPEGGVQPDWSPSLESLYGGSEIQPQGLYNGNGLGGHVRANGAFYTYMNALAASADGFTFVMSAIASTDAASSFTAWSTLNPPFDPPNTFANYGWSQDFNSQLVWGFINSADDGSDLFDEDTGNKTPMQSPTPFAASFKNGVAQSASFLNAPAITQAPIAMAQVVETQFGRWSPQPTPSGGSPNYIQYIGIFDFYTEPADLPAIAIAATGKPAHVPMSPALPTPLPCVPCCKTVMPCYSSMDTQP